MQVAARVALCVTPPGVADCASGALGRQCFRHQSGAPLAD